MIGAAGLGALAGLDRTAYAQTMLAHPVVCGTLAGWLAGDPVGGLRLGIVFGMLASRRAPIGGQGAVVDWTSAAVAVPFGLGEAAAGWQWGLGLLAGLGAALAGGHLIRLVRRFAAAREPALDRAAEEADLASIDRNHFGFLFLHALRGGALSLATAALVAALAYDLRWTGAEQSAAAMIWAFAPVVGVVVLLEAQRRHAGWRPLGFGVAVALTALLWAGVLT